MPTVEDLYQTARKMPKLDRFRLVERILSDLESESGHGSEIADRVRRLAMSADKLKPSPFAWRRSIGAFDDDAVMDEIVETGRRLREAERAPE